MVENIIDQVIEEIGLKESAVREKFTQLTGVKMNYDADLEGFTYYMDNKDISYYHLETAGRLYVLKNNCKKIFYLIFRSI